MSNIGFRIYEKPERLSRTIIEAFRGIPVANIADNMGRIACMDAQIKPCNSVDLLGSALTVRVPMGDNLMFHKALDMALPGDVIVVDGESSMDHSLCGEIMMRYAMKKGIAGFLIDGCIRDAAALKDMDFSVYARGVNPKGPYKNGPGEINVPVCCGGQAVLPGDLIVGDRDGVAVIRAGDAVSILEKARAHNRMEMKIFEEIEKNMLERSWVDQALKEKGCEVVNNVYTCSK